MICTFAQTPTLIPLLAQIFYQDTTGKGNKLFAGDGNFPVTEMEVFGKQH